MDGSFDPVEEYDVDGSFDPVEEYDLDRSPCFLGTPYKSFSCTSTSPPLDIQ